MKVLAVVAVLVAAAGCPTQGAEVSQLECQRYQETLTKSIRIREKCGLPAFSDCCQVGLVYYSCNTETWYQLPCSKLLEFNCQVTIIY